MESPSILRAALPVGLAPLPRLRARSARQDPRAALPYAQTFGRIAATYDYPVMVHGRYLMRPSPIPKFDNPKMDRNPALQLFGAGREKRIYAVPPYTSVKSLDFEDHPFSVETWEHSCGLCGSNGSYLDEIVTDDRGGRMFVCSDTDYCNRRQDQGYRGRLNSEAAE